MTAPTSYGKLIWANFAAKAFLGTLRILWLKLFLGHSLDEIYLATVICWRVVNGFPWYKFLAWVIAKAFGGWSCPSRRKIHWFQKVLSPHGSSEVLLLAWSVEFSDFHNRQYGWTANLGLSTTVVWMPVPKLLWTFMAGSRGGELTIAFQKHLHGCLLIGRNWGKTSLDSKFTSPCLTSGNRPGKG